MHSLQVWKRPGWPAAAAGDGFIVQLDSLHVKCTWFLPLKNGVLGWVSSASASMNFIHKSLLMGSLTSDCGGCCNPAKICFQGSASAAATYCPLFRSFDCMLRETSVPIYLVYCVSI